MLEPINKSSLIEEVVGRLTDYVGQAGLKSGARLPSENQLARDLGVSRPTVREALKVLETTGLIEKRHGSGAFIRPKQKGRPKKPQYSPKDLAEAALAAHKIRLSVETQCASLAAVRAGEDDIEKMNDALKRFGPALRQKDIAASVIADMDFHTAIVRATKNRALESLVSAVEPLIRENRRQTAQSYDSELMLAQHQKIFDCIKHRDPKGAEDAMREHISELMVFYCPEEK